MISGILFLHSIKYDLVSKQKEGCIWMETAGEVGMNGWASYCLELIHFEQVVQKLINQKGSKWFLGDNDTEGSNLGLLSIQRRLEESLYSTQQEFAKDVRKVDQRLFQGA
jgi:hypothetical protein